MSLWVIAPAQRGQPLDVPDHRDALAPRRASMSKKIIQTMCEPVGEAVLASGPEDGHQTTRNPNASPGVCVSLVS